MKATAKANSNIAIIKYWGRRDDARVIPSNNSISFTMDDQLQSVTTVEFSNRLKKDLLTINGKDRVDEARARVSRFLDIVRKMAGIQEKARVESKNSFPISAGLASSASGFAALSAAASKAASLELGKRQLSALARMGSGSASRSVYGGAVEWLAGKRRDGSDCYAIEISPPEKWSSLRNVIAITDSKEKEIGSTSAMERTVRTSEMFRCRLKALGSRIIDVRKAISKADFGSMADAIMKESDSMHAAMLDSWPPIRYLNDRSFAIMRRIIELNGSYGRPVAAYTFDAGPNAHIYTTTGYEHEVRRILREMDGIERTMVCQVGEGVRFSEKHLF